MKWMLDREEVKVSVPDPCWRRFVAEGGREFWGCTVTGNFRPDRPPAIPDSKGGFFCDEPVSPSSSINDAIRPIC